MKQRWNFIIILVIIVGVNLFVYGASPSKYLNSRLTVLSSRLLQEISAEIDRDDNFRFSIGYLPLMMVNGEDDGLVEYLSNQLETTIVENPFLNLISSQETLAVWTELQENGYSDQELFKNLGSRLEISGLIMASLVTNPNDYAIKALVINTKSGSYRNVELIDLDRKQIDILPYERKEVVEVGETETELSNVISQLNNSEEENTVTDTQNSSLIYPEMEDVQTGVIIDVEEPDSFSPSDSSSTINPTNDQANNSSDYLTAHLRLTGQSLLMQNLLLGFSIGDMNGDGTDELVYSDGMNLNVRKLNDYTFLWSKSGYLPASNDHKILLADIDQDGMDEMLSHGNFIELVDDQLISSQPRFISRPVSLYGQDGIALFNRGIVYVVNYQGLIMKKYQLGEDYGKRFAFADLDGDGQQEFITTMAGEDEGASIQVFEVTDELTNPQTLDGVYGFAIHIQDLNGNGLPEVYCRRNFFDGEEFLYSKIFVMENRHGKLTLIAESPKLDYFIVDFSAYPKKDPTRLVVGGMYLQHKRQAIQEIQSSLFFYTLE